jgi:hypothetical protein
MIHFLSASRSIAAIEPMDPWFEHTERVEVSVQAADETVESLVRCPGWSAVP